MRLNALPFHLEQILQVLLFKKSFKNAIWNIFVLESLKKSPWGCFRNLSKKFLLNFPWITSKLLKKFLQKTSKDFSSRHLFRNSLGNSSIIRKSINSALNSFKKSFKSSLENSLNNLLWIPPQTAAVISLENLPGVFKEIRPQVPSEN